MFTWGSKTMKVKKGSYQAPFPSLTITELEVIPNATGEGLEILQTGGLSRKKPAMRVRFKTIEEYNEYCTDYLSSTQRIFSDIYGNTMNAMIYYIGPVTNISANWIECDIQFLEV